jgi:starch synthase
MTTPDNLKVLFLSPEIVPFAKTGGLADVAGALPLALNSLGAEVRLVLPFYRTIRKGDFEIRPFIDNIEIPLGKDTLKAAIKVSHLSDGIPVYLVEREDLYNRPNLYGNASGGYYDNLERFSFYAHAVLILMRSISFAPHIIHCHDWQTGLIPALLKGPYKNNRLLSETPTVFTIHNLGYQGIFPSEKLPTTGLPKEDFFHLEGVEFWGNISLLKTGIMYSEAITTVSPSYAVEIQTREFGMGMEGVLQRRKDVLHGILNGIDYHIWNPEKDRHVPANYSQEEMAGKLHCKIALIKETGLDPSISEKPLLGIITRLDAQKGLDLLLKILDDLLSMDLGLVVLGSGDEGIRHAIQDAADRFPGRIFLNTGFDEPLAHRIMAGTDIFLIPSRYEPCGLTQMYALKYGTVPIVRATGGLKDTVVQFNTQTGKGNGFKFRPYKPASFLRVIRTATKLFNHPKTWQRLISNGMKADFSWDRSARSYMKLYESLMMKSKVSMRSRVGYSDKDGTTLRSLGTSFAKASKGSPRHPIGPKPARQRRAGVDRSSSQPFRAGHFGDGD